MCDMNPLMTVAQFAISQVGSQKFLFESLAVLIKVIPASNLQDFLERCLVQPFLDGAAGDVKMSVLRGLAAALKINDPPQKVPLLLYHAVESIYSMTSLQEKVCCSFDFYCSCCNRSRWYVFPLRMLWWLSFVSAWRSFRGASLTELQQMILKWERATIKGCSHGAV